MFNDIRKVKSYEYYTNFFVRGVNNAYPSMIPTEIFNPFKKTHHRLVNNRISKKRLNSILHEKRYKMFTNFKSVNSIKLVKEWTKRGFIENNRLSEKGKELLKEIDIINKLIQSDIGFAKIKSVSRVKSSNDFVYDLSVKYHENFIGGYGGLCCHNSRVNATYTTDISSRGPTFTIRKFTREPWTPIKLMDFGTVSPEVLAYLWLLIEHEANMMVIGGTGSGKTSFLNSLAFFIPPAARVVTIEDTRELNLLHENWLPSVARAGVGMANITGERHGEVSLFDLLRESFRQRPDYVIVGEIRGKEAFVLFQGAASGHPTLSTMHAESVDTMVKRLETHPIDLSPSLVETLNVVCVMVQTQVGGKPVRRLKEVVEIIRVPSEGNAIVNIPFARDPAKDIFFYKTDSKMLDKISKEHGIPKQILLTEWQRRINLLMAMYRKKMFGFKEVYEVINEYYKTPQEVLRRFGLK